MSLINVITLMHLHLTFSDVVVCFPLRAGVGPFPEPVGDGNIDNLYSTSQVGIRQAQGKVSPERAQHKHMALS